MNKFTNSISPRALYTVGLTCFIAAFLSGILLGGPAISPTELPRLLSTGPDNAGDNAFKLYALWQMRLPRIFSASIGGAALAASGLLVQAITGRQTASPFTLAISPGAAFGNMCCFIAGMPYFFSASFIGAAAGLIIALLGAELAAGKFTGACFFWGLATALALSTGTLAMDYLAEGDFVSALMFFLGDFSDAEWFDMMPLAICFCIFLFVCSFSAQEIDMLLSSEGDFFRSAIPKKNIAIILSGSCIIISCITGRFGIFTLFGLVVPNCILDILPHADRRHALSLCMVFGAATMCMIDTISRVTTHLSSGFLTLIIGTPMLLIIVFEELFPGNKND